MVIKTQNRYSMYDIQYRLLEIRIEPLKLYLFDMELYYDISKVINKFQTQPLKFTHFFSSKVSTFFSYLLK